MGQNIARPGDAVGDLVEGEGRQGDGRGAGEWKFMMRRISLPERLFEGFHLVVLGGDGVCLRYRSDGMSLRKVFKLNAVLPQEKKGLTSDKIRHATVEVRKRVPVLIVDGRLAMRLAMRVLDFPGSGGGFTLGWRNSHASPTVA